MPLRFNTLTYSYFNSIFSRKFLLLLVLLTLHFKGFTQASNEETIKEANRLFEEEEFTKAYKLFAQIVANYPKDPVYNFKLGVCMIYSEPDKTRCIPYLKIADGQPKDAPKEIKFYMGKALHINYRFDEALVYYNDYKKTASSSMQKKLQVDREIRACVNGKRLLSNLTDLVVLSKKTLNESDYFRSYDLKTIGGKLLVKPEDFKTGTDKKKKDNSVVYLAKMNDKVYYSSYGPDRENGRDIYYRTKQANGQFGEAVKVKGINTEFDEDYPFLHPNGTTLYFSSKGHNSMGGYDIFKSNYIEQTDSWTAPVNMEFPINSPDDDFLFVTDSLEKTAYFSTGRQSLPGKIDVLKVNTERKPIDILAMKGTILKESADQSTAGKITVKNVADGSTIGVYECEANGDYKMELPNGAKLLFTVETPGLKTQSEKVFLPLVSSSKPLRQSISYDKGILKITNYFEESSSDDSYVQYLKIIEEKAKLEVNEGKNNLGNALAVNDTIRGPGNTDSNTGPSVVEDTTSVKTPTSTVKTQSVVAKNNTNLNNSELSKIAKQDAEESQKEANVLQQDANDGFELGNLTKIEAEKKIKQGEDEFQNAQIITDPDQKAAAEEKAIAIKTQGLNELENSKKILEYANALNDDAKNKQLIASLNKEYAAETDKMISSKKSNPESLAKLDQLRKKIDEASAKSSNADNSFTSIKNDADEREKEFSKIENANNTLKNEITEIKNELKAKEDELSRTKKKKDKEPIQNKIDELKQELEVKEKQLVLNEIELEKAKNEVAQSKNQLDLANKIKTETIAVPINTITASSGTSTSITSNNPKNETSTKIPASQTLSEKYSNNIQVNDPTNKTEVEAVITQLKNYNKEVDAALAKNKTDLAKTKNAAAKSEINKEIKQLENIKKENQQLIAAKNSDLSNIAKASASASVSPQPEFTAISSTNNKDALGKLDKLNTSLNTTDNSNFDFNSYQNQQAQAMKVEADAKINEAAAQQKKLKEIISTASEQVKNTSPSNTNTGNNPYIELNKEAEDLSIKAVELRKEAGTKSGSEKEELIAKAVENEKKADEKHLEAALILQSDNKSVFETNAENLNSLKQLNKASETDLSEVSRLTEEANTAFKQAASIREEGNSQTNIAAKLGNFSNAEEKEAEALSKQEQALYIMKKTSGNVPLKTASTSSNSATSSGTVDLSPALEKVNTGLNELGDIKISAYTKLYEANKTELDQISSNLNTNRETIDKNATLKAEENSANSKLTKSQELKQNTDSETDKNKKLKDLIAATRLQIEAINQLNTVNKKLSQPIATNTNKNENVNANKNENTNKNENPDNKNENTNKGNENIVTNKNTNENKNANNEKNENANNKNENVSVNNKTENKNKTEAKSNETLPAIDTKTFDVNELAVKDTTTADMIASFEKEPSLITNPGANEQAKQSLAELKKLEKESKDLDNGLNPVQGNNGSTSPKKIRSDAEIMLEEAEELNVKAFNERTVANTKTGAEKDSLMALSTKHEEESNAKKLKAVKLTEQANTAIYSDNNTAITEMIGKAKTDNPALSDQLSEKINAIATLKSQADQLRAEANGQSDNNAKIGAMMNAEEKEAEMLTKQKEVIDELKKQYPDYIVKETLIGQDTKITPEEITALKKEVKEKQYSQLTNLTNAYSLEFETSKNKIPAELNEDQKKVKTNADELNAESKRLLIKSAGETDPIEKNKQVSLAAKTGKAAVEQLNKLNPEAIAMKSNSIVASNNKNTNAKNNTVKNNTVKNNTTNNKNNATTANTNNNKNNNLAVNNKTTNTAKNNTNVANNSNTNENANETPVKNNGRGTVKIEGLEVVAGNAYSEAKPIPMNAAMPDGLVFRVQIGAFKTPLPNNTFKGLNPLNGENASNGYIRYTAGNFNKIENANAVKNDLRKLGYADAFVVVYYNGKRITLAEALELMAKEGKVVDNSAPTSAGITTNANIPKVNNPPNTNANAVEVVKVTKELEQINGLLFTVQIGVYTKQANRRQLLGLSPIYTEKLPTGLYRYTAGIYSNTDRLISDKGRVVNLGVRDAFVSAYLNGKRIPFAEGKTAQQDANTKMEPENPIVFPEGNINPPAANNNAPVANTNPTPANPPTNVKPFTNNVTSYPEANAENGIKNGQDGVCFKVQIGAYSKQVPNDVAAKFMSIKNWPIENKQINVLFIYNIGNFTSAKFAKTLKDEAVKAGITDAFITVYKDGTKLTGAEASALLNQQ